MIASSLAMTAASPHAILPLFPLGTTLFPQGLLSLRVFELRYLALVGECHKASLPFGVVSLTQGAEVRVPGADAEQFAHIGTLARITQLSRPQPGLLVIECQGLQRFRIHSRSQQKNGLWTAQTQLLPDEAALTIPPDLQHTATALQRLVQTLQSRHDLQAATGAPAPRLPVGHPYRWDDGAWVANRWCELLPIQPELRQRLLELDSPLLRLELVSDLLARTGIAQG
ncbi:MAG: peptidase S16 [Comamonadaceae bacterium]|nr:MAG: peptidase S16 [Comamonadaceae bacterium]